MSDYVATVIKTGNSIALRVPKRYADDANLVPGEKVKLNLPKKYQEQDRLRIKRLFQKLKEAMAFNEITDPAAWQKQVRSDRPLTGRNR